MPVPTMRWHFGSWNAFEIKEFFDGVLNKMGGLSGVDYSQFSNKLNPSEFGEALEDAEAAFRKFGQDPENMQEYPAGFLKILSHCVDRHPLSLRGILGVNISDDLVKLRISDLPALPSPGRDAVLQIPELYLSSEITNQGCVRLTWHFKAGPDVEAPENITEYEVYSLGVDENGSIEPWDYVDNVRNVKLPVRITFAKHDDNYVLFFAIRAKQRIRDGNGGYTEKWSEFSNIVRAPAHSAQSFRG